MLRWCIFLDLNNPTSRWFQRLMSHWDLKLTPVSILLGKPDSQESSFWGIKHPSRVRWQMEIGGLLRQIVCGEWGCFWAAASRCTVARTVKSLKVPCVSLMTDMKDLRSVIPFISIYYGKLWPTYNRRAHEQRGLGEWLANIVMVDIVAHKNLYSVW